MNPASEGLRPAVDLHRPRRGSLRRRRPTLGASALEGRFQSAWRPAGHRRRPTEKGILCVCVGGGRRLARSPDEADFNRRKKAGTGRLWGAEFPSVRSPSRRASPMKAH